ncbi:P-loop containing nucleoside triphosphate hydrolase protein [Phellopilus nigrolimitatus]|nr:P-loop containing nucleoside triphosphate hydrolase protein [Phellopilus nigrolimitatus]
MKDQIDQLLDKGIYAIPLYHSQDSAIYKQAINELKNSSHPPAFVYLTPERFSLPEWVELTDHLYQSGRLGLVVIDEAQVVLEWGPDYRPLYMELRVLKKRVPNIPILALSGSMSPTKLKSYVKHMGIQGCQLISKHPDRPNIYYDIIPMDDKGMDAEIVKYVKSGNRQSPTFSGIVYCRTPRHCNVLQKRLKKAGISSVLYTGQMAQEKKTMSYQLWKHNFCYLMLATISFGMGIDKEDVRYILHRDLPKDLSAYIQETGRAGRDGGPAKCVLFYRFTDCHKNYALATRDHSSEKRLDLLKQEIIPPSQELLKMCSSLTTCRRAHILAHYDIPPPPEPCKNCDVCCHPYQDRNVARVKKTFVCRLIKFFTGKKEENEEHISISNLTEGFAKEVPFHPFKTLLGLDDEQDAKAKSTNGRTRITARVVQNLILQGLFTEYPHQASPENINFYLKVTDVFPHVPSSCCGADCFS